MSSSSSAFLKTRGLLQHTRLASEVYYTEHTIGQRIQHGALYLAG